MRPGDVVRFKLHPSGSLGATAVVVSSAQDSGILAVRTQPNGRLVYTVETDVLLDTPNGDH